MLISRFILNLRALNHSSDADLSSTAANFSRFSDPDFMIPGSVLGNIGGPLVHGEDPRVAVQDASAYELSGNVHEVSTAERPQL